MMMNAAGKQCGMEVVECCSTVVPLQVSLLEGKFDFFPPYSQGK